MKTDTHRHRFSVEPMNMTRRTSMDHPDVTILQRVWRSIFPAPVRPRTQRDRQRFLRRNLILHFRPPTVKEKTLLFRLSWGLGGMAATLVLLQMATGILLKFIYVPTPADAYASVQSIVSQVPFGRLVRNLHHWCANLLVVVLMLHMLRVFFTGAFHHPRQFNWVIGVALFAMVLAANLSGYLLPYDQLAYWAVTVFTAMIGYIPVIGDWLQRALGDGSELGPQTLPFFYSFHTAVIPLLLTGLMGFHFWRIRKAGGLVVPRGPSEPIDAMPARVPVVPNLLIRELSMALAATAGVLVLAIFSDAVLSAPANPGMSPNPVRAPWYFAGLQELLLHVHPVVAVCVIPLAAGIFLLSLPYLAYPQSTEGIWFASARGRAQSITAALVTTAIVPALIVADALVVKTAPWAVGMSPLLRDGILPMLFLAVLTAGIVHVMKKRMGATLSETVQSLFVVMVTTLVVLTLVGVFFRGPFMQLAWPI
jgi:quinol-cytochrome oxidoreductase complex cytochrome b subunit